jgi:5'(3')-deoxyribonucleotidase
MTNKTYYFDMDGVLANFHKEPYKYTNAINKEWIANLDPFMENVNLVRELLIAGVEVYILSKAASEGAKLGKLEWLAKFIPEMPVENVIVIVGNGKKADFIKTETGVLVDDDIKNTRPWMKAGYEAITLEYRGQTVVLN